jgi:chromosome segregation ATPase
MTASQELDRARRAIAELDLSSENAQIAELEADIRRFNEAITTADERRSEIQRILRDRRGPDAHAVAEALLDGKTAMQAAREDPTDDDLKRELESLRAAIGELRDRVESARQGIESIQSGARQRAAECFSPIVDRLTDELRDVAELMVSHFAALRAINDATKGHTLARLSAERALPGLYGTDGLIAYRRQVPVPADIVDALRRFEGKGAALPARVPAMVPLP